MERMIAAERMTRSQDGVESDSPPNTPPADPIEVGLSTTSVTAFSPYSSTSSPPPLIEDDTLDLAGGSQSSSSDPDAALVVAPLVFFAEEQGDSEESPPSRGNSPGSVAEGGFMTADRSSRGPMERSMDWLDGTSSTE